jgi:hypothetical protein
MMATGRRLDDTVLGKYTGNGSTKTIKLDFRPTFVKIYSPDGHKTTKRDGETNCKLHYVSWGGSLNFGTHNTAIEINDQGFTVSGDYTNKNNKIYEFIAIQYEEGF